MSVFTSSENPGRTRFNDSVGLDFFKDDERTGYGYRGKKSRKNQICIIRCPSCGRENYIIAVASGKCAWCGLDAAKDITPYAAIKKS